MERVQFAAAGEVLLDGDIHLVDDSRSAPVVVCHPHPDYGGDRFHPLMTAVWTAASERGRSVLRFDFRRATEARPLADLEAALDLLEERLGRRPVDVIGYSFGAITALSSVDTRIGRIVAVAPPSLPTTEPGVPVLILVPEHDQFRPPDQVRAQCAEWRSLTIETIAGTDHFLAGQISSITETALNWLDRPVGR